MARSRRRASACRAAAASRRVTSTAFSFPFATAKSVLPFVLTRSGSSTPSSWTFVPEKSTPCSGAPCGCAGRPACRRLADDRRRRARTARRSGRPATWRSRAGRRSSRTRRGGRPWRRSPRARSRRPSRRCLRRARRRRESPAPQRKRRVFGSPSPDLYVTKASSVTSGSVRFCTEGRTSAARACPRRRRDSKGAPNELVLDHSDRCARACTARFFRSRPLLDRPDRAGLGRPALAGRPFRRRCVGGQPRPRRSLACRPRFRAAAARRHGAPERRCDRQRALLGFRDDDGRAVRGRDADPARCCGPDPAPARPDAAGRVDGAPRPRARRRPPPRAAFPPLRASDAALLRRAPRPPRAAGGSVDDDADHPLALPGPHAAPARRRAPRDRGRRGPLARDDLDGRGPAEPLLAPLRDELRRRSRFPSPRSSTAWRRATSPPLSPAHSSPSSRSA